MTHRPGLTLIEQLISIVLLIGITIIMVNIFIASSRFVGEEEQRIQVGETAARALSTLDDTLREGRVILASGSVDGTTYTTSASTLVLGLPSVIGGIPSANNDIVVIALDPTTQILEQHTAPYTGSSRPGGTIQLATGVSEIYLRYVSDDPVSSTAVTVVVSSKRQTGATSFARQILLYATLRNHP